eukprot:247053-Rhodomonas_salina.3
MPAPASMPPQLVFSMPLGGASSIGKGAEKEKQGVERKAEEGRREGRTEGGGGPMVASHRVEITRASLAGLTSTLRILFLPTSFPPESAPPATCFQPCLAASKGGGWLTMQGDSHTEMPTAPAWQQHTDVISMSSHRKCVAREMIPSAG